VSLPFIHPRLPSECIHDGVHGRPENGWKEGRSVQLPSNFRKKWGYDLECNFRGSLDDLKIDFEAIAEHIYQLHVSAKNYGIDIWRVIFDPKPQPHLQSSARWPYLKDNV
jgi:penicillin-insensitive murein endopeptidase